MTYFSPHLRGLHHSPWCLCYDWATHEDTRRAQGKEDTTALSTLQDGPAGGGGSRGTRGWTRAVVAARATGLICLGARGCRAFRRGSSRRGSRRPRYARAGTGRVADLVGRWGLCIVPGPIGG